MVLVFLTTNFPTYLSDFIKDIAIASQSVSGLGLYLTRQIIEAQGGTIWAENRTPQGALFGFRLPAHQNL
jgi:two-component system NarL family sensor kinase